MFNRLPESDRKRQRRTGGVVVSTVIHLVFIALAVKASGLKAAPAPKPQVDRLPIYINRADPPPTPPQPTQRTSTTSDPGVVAPTPLLPTIDEIPSTIPAPSVDVDLMQAFQRVDARIASRGGERITTDGPGSGPLLEGQVEQPVMAVPGTAVPRYPSMLQSAGVEGDVRAQFVVDTLGRVEPGSFKVLESTHDLFGTAVRDALTRARFQPAKLGGRNVRQLVEQTFTFRITR